MKLNKFGTFLRKQRIANGISLRQFAKEVKLSPSMIVQIETKGSIPSEKSIIKIAQFFDGDKDFWLAMADKVSKDIKIEIISSMGLWSHFIRSHPNIILDFLEKSINKK